MGDLKNSRDSTQSESGADSSGLGGSDKGIAQYLPNPIRRLWAGVGFLTKIPVPTWIIVDTDSLSSSRPYFPAVGAIVGLGLALVDRFFTALFPIPVACALDLVFMFFITGGIHWDGLIDTVDGILGAHTREDALRIMRDSRIGALGAIAAVILMITKYSLLVSIPPLQLGSDRLVSCPRFRALIVSPILARWCMCLVMHIFPYARKEGGLGSLFVRRHRFEDTGKRKMHWTLTDLVLPGVFTGACAIGIAGAKGAWAFMLCSLVSLFGGWRISRFLKGLTGDTFGAVCEICEIVALLVFCMNI